MVNSEDYLDGLLNSVQTVRKDVAQAENAAEENRRMREEERNKIKPQDDFMEASGLNEYVFEPTSHDNLKKAFSEEDFLRNFEAELEMDDQETDDFIKEFEKEIELEEQDYQEESDLSDSQDEEPSFMDNINGIVNQAKEQINNGQMPDNLPDLPAEEEMSLENAFEDAQNREEKVYAEELPEANDEPQDFDMEESS